MFFTFNDEEVLSFHNWHSTICQPILKKYTESFLIMERRVHQFTYFLYLSVPVDMPVILKPSFYGQL